jgi:hypothetical protein
MINLNGFDPQELSCEEKIGYIDIISKEYITSISGYSYLIIEMIMKQKYNEDEILKYLEVISDSANKLRDIMTLFRIK